MAQDPSTSRSIIGTCPTCAVSCAAGAYHRNAGSERNVFRRAERASGEEQRSDELDLDALVSLLVKKPPLDKSSESESESESSSFSHSNSESTSQSFFLKNGEPLPVCFNWSGVETGGLVEASHELAHDQNFSSVEEIAEYCGTHPYCNFFTYPEGKLYSTADTDVSSSNPDYSSFYSLGCFQDSHSESTSASASASADGEYVHHVL